MKVALLSHGGGGISSVCYGLAYALSRKKIETTVLSATAIVESKDEDVNEYLQFMHLPTVDYPPRALWFCLRNANRLSKLVENFDVVHAISPDMAFAYTNSKHSPKPLVTSLHGSHRAAMSAFARSPMRDWTSSDFAFNVLELPLHEIIARRCVAKSNRVVVCSHSTLNELRTYDKIGTPNVSVIYNGIDLDEMHLADNLREDENSNGERGYSIMYAGRLFWMKGITFLLKAYESLKKQFDNIHLTIFGKGPLESEVRRFVASQGSRGNVHFGGFIPHRELIKEIVRTDVVVFPSLYESQPMFLLEAMACRKPVIAFNLPYAREIVKDGYNGLLARAYDVEDLSRKIALALQDKKLRLMIGEKGHEYVEENHNWDMQVNKYLQLYKETIE